MHSPARHKEALMARSRTSRVARFCALALMAASPGAAQSPARGLEGMWSDPPVTIIGRLCAFVCSDAGINAMNALLDDPKNDAVPFAQLQRLAGERHAEYVRSSLSASTLKTFPLDPADDPSFLQCVPWGLPRQMFAPHQLEIRGMGPDRLELHYGEWDARRTVFMDGRPQPRGQPPTRLGHSVGRWEGDALVIETTGVARSLMWGGGMGVSSNGFETSDQLSVVVRFVKAADGKTLTLTATLTDPVSLRAPLVLKHMWRWAPESRIDAYDECQIPTDVKRGVK
jgi:hypothetical protein